MRVFGMKRRHRGENVREVRVGNSVIMLRPPYEADGASGGSSVSLYVYVDDLKAHFAQTQAGGATIVEEIKKHGDRYYIAEDLEGRRWTFAQARPTQR